jgi:hypothetical protein
MSPSDAARIAICEWGLGFFAQQALTPVFLQREKVLDPEQVEAGHFAPEAW